MAYTLGSPIKMELRRIQRLIDLNHSGEISQKLGSLCFEKRGDHTYCYQAIYENGKRIEKRYLGSPDSDAVRKYCSLRYRQELLRRIHLNQKLLQKAESTYLMCDPSSIYSSLPAACSKISSEAFIDERYEELKAWASADYQKNMAPFPKTVNYAKDGTRIRSKGECIKYNLLLEKGIPFRYDSIMTITDKDGFRKNLSPDFLIKCYDGTYVIIEHLGWLGDKKYALDYGDKCYWYLHKGFVPGKNSFVTSDDEDGGTDSASIESVISRVEEIFWGLN